MKLKQEATRLPAKNVTVVDKELRLEVDLPIELTGNIIINSIVVYDMSGSVLAIGNIPPVEPMVVNRKYSLDIRIKIANAEIVHFYEMHNYNVDITRLFGDLKSNTNTQLAAVTAKVDQSVDELNKKVNNTTTDLTERVNRSLSDANNQLNSSLTNIRTEVTTRLNGVTTENDTIRLINNTLKTWDRHYSPDGAVCNGCTGTCTGTCGGCSGRCSGCGGCSGGCSGCGYTWAKAVANIYYTAQKDNK